MKYYDFSDAASLSDFIPGHSPRWPGKLDFVQLGDSVANYEPEREGFTDYISAITKARYGNGCKLTMTCMFESFGAPILMLTDTCTEDGDGSVTYGPHFEICVYEEGVNVWLLFEFPESPIRIKAYKTDFAKFSLQGGERITVTAVIKGRTMELDINGHKLTVADPHIPETFHVGITACEGRNRIYDLKIEP